MLQLGQLLLRLYQLRLLGVQSTGQRQERRDGAAKPRQHPHDQDRCHHQQQFLASRQAAEYSAQ